MAVKQNYGIKYPFTYDNNDKVYVDLNKSYYESVKSKVLHVIFTPKGQKLRNPDFGTDIVKYIFEQSDDITYQKLREDIIRQISKYVKNVVFNDLVIYNDENDQNHIIVIVKYSVKTGNKEIATSVAVRL